MHILRRYPRENPMIDIARKFDPRHGVDGGLLGLSPWTSPIDETQMHWAVILDSFRRDSFRFEPQLPIYDECTRSVGCLATLIGPPLLPEFSCPM
jgi:hypothetical protein